MKFARLLAACLGGILVTSASFAESMETPYEEPIQYALENLTSGVSTAALIRGTEVVVKPVRTWKSVSGHYCRRYEIRITEPGTQPFEGERTRCRETTGAWRPVIEN